MKKLVVLFVSLLIIGGAGVWYSCTTVEARKNTAQIDDLKKAIEEQKIEKILGDGATLETGEKMADQ